MTILVGREMGKDTTRPDLFIIAAFPILQKRFMVPRALSSAKG
jgi:hypothetical protein